MTYQQTIQLPAMLVMMASIALVTPAAAQIIVPGNNIIVPPPPPLPPPKIEVPVVPKFDAPPQVNLKPLPKNSFGDRVVRCLDAGAAAGLGPSARARYSEACANQ